MLIKHALNYQKSPVGSVKSLQECSTYEICSEWTRKHAGTLVWSSTDGDRRRNFSDNTEGDKHLSHHQMLFVCCNAPITAPWWRSEARQADVFHSTLLLFVTPVLSPVIYVHVNTPTPSAPTVAACITSEIKIKYTYTSLQPYITHTLPCLLLSFPYPSLGNLFSLRRQETVRGHAGKTADRRRREEDVWAVWQHRGVHGAPRAWRHKQR